TTVLGQTIRNVKETAVHDIVVVTGHQATDVEAIAQAEGVKAIHNPQFAQGEMLSSLQTAVRHLPPNVEAVLVVLADQPMVKAGVMDKLLTAFWQMSGELIAPTFNGKRGNPVLIGRPFFAELLALPPTAAPRTLLKRHQGALYMVPVATDSILRDLDEWEGYVGERP
ncbi:MAG: nucleotidyltransferase family protein, partial [Chloroflexi bacterium]|nr:nucleotidyltransferase family protein [Chloroflexota bacterium]